MGTPLRPKAANEQLAPLPGDRAKQRGEVPVDVRLPDAEEEVCVGQSSAVGDRVPLPFEDGMYAPTVDSQVCGMPVLVVGVAASDAMARSHSLRPRKRPVAVKFCQLKPSGSPVVLLIPPGCEFS